MIGADDVGAVPDDSRRARRRIAANAEGDWSAIEEHATALMQWLDHGGFPPKVIEQDLGSEWNSALARAGCLLAIETVHGKWSILQQQV